MGAAGMGRVGAIAMAGDEAQAKVRDQQIQQLEAIEQLKAQDEARASQQLASLSLQEAEGAQLAARDAQTAKAAAITSGLGAVTGVAENLISLDPETGEGFFNKLYKEEQT
jgi:non-ribosomal peptide synthetase component E (peptide arylation enzyme)